MRSIVRRNFIFITSDQYPDWERFVVTLPEYKVGIGIVSVRDFICMLNAQSSINAFMRFKYTKINLNAVIKIKTSKINFLGQFHKWLKLNLSSIVSISIKKSFFCSSNIETSNFIWVFRSWFSNKKSVQNYVCMSWKKILI